MTNVTTPTAQDVAEWLNSRERTRATPVLVTIGHTSYVGATFEQERDHAPGTRAYAEGERTYMHRGLYLLGALPSSYVHRRARLYVDPAYGTSYYVAGWFPASAASEQANEFHPFGPMFLLAPNDYGVADGPTMPLKIRG